jgi:hypothetical protein
MNIFNRTLQTAVIVFLIVFTANAFADKNTNYADSQEKYSKLKIFITSEADIKKINDKGLFFDHAEVESGKDMIVWLSLTEIEMLKKSGVSYQILIDDWQNYYSSLPKMTEQEISDAIRKSMEDYSVSHSIYGSMGGYLIYSEVVNKLDSMRLQYPNLISTKFSIGNSVEGRAMWTVRVSDNPDITTGRPEVWFHSLIHAREPMSMEQNIYFMYWLFENYNIDPIATYILKYRELYFTPVFNPDGYEYNRTTNPSGGGMWRKNRKLNSGSTYGIDLNRNYGTYAFWNSTNNGSSTDPTSDTYRGTSPFSEPETQNARDFVISRNFKGALSYHTYGNYLIRPWGYVDAPTPDENIFQSFSQDMVLNNHFTLGRSNQTVNYGVRGVTDDWYYSDSAHTKMIAFTPEVGTGTDGFWPLQSRIVFLAASTLSQNIYFALACGPYVAPNKTVLDKEQYLAGDNGNLKVYFKNKGLMNAQNVKIELTSQSPLINIQTNSFSYPSVNTFATDSISFPFTVAGNAPNNGAIKATLKIKQNDTNTVYIKDIYVVVGGGNILLLDSAENGISRWTAAGGWGVTTSQFYSPSNCFADSPTGNYTNTTTRSLTLTNSINVSASPVLILSYWYKHTIDTLDNAYVEVSPDNGTTWQSAKFYNKTVSTWTKEVIDITDLAGGSASMKLRFSLVSNGTIVADGIYIDNIKLTSYNSTPTGITVNNEIPGQFSLSQNYPNPFNPVTVINYSIPAGNNVTLKVYNIIGKEVMTLVNERQNAGNYSVTFDGGSLSSGMYYYKMESGNFMDTKKMILIK